MDQGSAAKVPAFVSVCVVVVCDELLDESYLVHGGLECDLPCVARCLLPAVLLVLVLPCACRVCRGPFNLAAWRHRPLRSVDTLGVEQIWALKHEGGNRVRGALGRRPTRSHVEPRFRAGRRSAQMVHEGPGRCRLFDL